MGSEGEGSREKKEIKEGEGIGIRGRETRREMGTKKV